MGGVVPYTVLYSVVLRCNKVPAGRSCGDLMHYLAYKGTHTWTTKVSLMSGGGDEPLCSRQHRCPGPD